MKHPEADYINAGFKYETGKAPADTIRAMLDAEHPHDRPEARRLIEEGRAEGRQVSRK
jgi:hypothetical protein